MKIDLEQIRHLVAVVSETDITELTIESGDEKITVRKAAQQAGQSGGTNHVEYSTAGTVPVATATKPVAATPQTTTSSPAQNHHSEESTNGLVPITSPMVGTFYRSPAPTSPAFVDVGDRVNIGQTVCIIEAMKLMNDLPAEISGKIVKILVENGTTVEFGQQLMLVDPKG